jgi:hypothetical protein
MNRPAAFLVLLMAVPACTYGDGLFVTPTLPSNSTFVITSVGAITVGQQLRGTFIGNPLIYDLRAPSSGSLVLRLTWDSRANGARFMLTVGNTRFLASAPYWSPVVGRATVFAGQTYRVRIEEGFAPWDYGFNEPFVLMATIE